MSVEAHELLAITPIDGRYAGKTAELSPHLSEFGLIKHRVAVEVGWLSTLGMGTLPDVEPLGQVAQDHLVEITEGFGVDDAAAVKERENTTNHDVQAVVVWLKDRLAGDGGYDDYLELVHFGCTSEDINSTAYARMLGDARSDVIVPHLNGIADKLDEKAHVFAGIPLLSLTHGQSATPTTLGKEMRVVSERAEESIEFLRAIKTYAKFSGASGNFAAHTVAYPEVNWPKVAEKFLRGMGINMRHATTQIEPHDWMARMFNELSAGNNILTDLSTDMWLYIMRGAFKLRVVEGEVGSSAMPHKVNPIDFENAESNLQTGTALFRSLADRLPRSRMQRDLGDSSTQRVIGTAFGHTLVGYKSLARGLGKVDPNTVAIEAELFDKWEVLAEAVQTVLRRHRVPGAYDKLKAATRGIGFTETSYVEFVMGLDIPEDARERLLDLTPENYTGLSQEIAEA